MVLYLHKKNTYLARRSSFIGAKINQSDIPVCSIFKPRIYFDQICYETDLQELKDRSSKILEEQLELGLTLLLDYNEERQINYNFVPNATKKAYFFHDNSVSIYLDTISITYTYTQLSLTRITTKV